MSINLFLGTLAVTVVAYIILEVTIWFIKSQSCYRTDSIEHDFSTIKKELDIWDRWGFDPKTNQFIGFTLHDIFEDGSAAFKPKFWIKGNKDIFNTLMTFEITRRSYTEETEYFIEKN